MCRFIFKYCRHFSYTCSSKPKISCYYFIFCRQKPILFRKKPLSCPYTSKTCRRFPMTCCYIPKACHRFPIACRHFPMLCHRFPKACRHSFDNPRHRQTLNVYLESLKYCRPIINEGLPSSD